MVKLGFLDKERERKRVKPFFFMTYYMDIFLKISLKFFKFPGKYSGKNFLCK